MWFDAEVNRGTKWLNVNCPNWVSRIDKNELDMTDENCILGQLELKELFDKQHPSNDLNENGWGQIHCDFGFTTPEISLVDLEVDEKVIAYSAELCKEAWLREIAARKKKFFVYVTWNMSYTYEVDAASKEEAEDKVYDMELPSDGNYIDDSFNVEKIYEA